LALQDGLEPTTP